MIWEYKVMIIVMTTKTVENHVNKCEKYWPLQTGTYLLSTEGPRLTRILSPMQFA